MGVWSAVESKLHYKAPKKVEVRSLNLGILSKIPVIAVFFYIVVYQILYQNKHMGKARPAGMARLQLQRPTRQHCNPNHANCKADYTPFSQLHYCLPNGTAPPDKNEGTKAGGRMPCRYLDEKQMNPGGLQHFTLMVPTRITKMTQKASGNCGPNATKECENVYEFIPGEAESVYVADVERFTLLIETAFTLPPEDLSRCPVRRGASNDFVGYWEVCDDPRLHRGCRQEKIPCRMKGCDGSGSGRRLRAALQEEEGGGADAADGPRRLGDGKMDFFGLAFGDVVSVGDLLTMSGVDLEKDTDMHGESRRSTGIALQIDVEYTNRGHWRWSPFGPASKGMHYVYRVSKLPFQTYKQVQEEASLDGKTRVLTDSHGIFINVNIQGSVHYFDITQLLLILTTGLSLLAGCDVALDFFATNCWQFKEEYKNEKTDRSRNYDKEERLCFCLPIHAGHHVNSEDKDWRYFSERPAMFTEELRALDGDTLRCAGDLLMSLHRLKAREQGDPDWVATEVKHWEAEKSDGGDGEMKSREPLLATEGRPSS